MESRRGGGVLLGFQRNLEEGWLTYDHPRTGNSGVLENAGRLATGSRSLLWYASHATAPGLLKQLVFRFGECENQHAVKIHNGSGSVTPQGGNE